ncbi:hypothetical protein NDU88_001617 [Pleurodeles waltl]|uniref:Uncharacterized protein n=1 Tax=Pleurodeles waltl TaxID=8319 RepID=A0AAV7R7N1_PLEWA|nr:hypothetical protein NDU88_001617 [Pleurodeles waltl]
MVFNRPLFPVAYRGLRGILTSAGVRASRRGQFLAKMMHSHNPGSPSSDVDSVFIPTMPCRWLIGFVVRLWSSCNLDGILLPPLTA